MQKKLSIAILAFLLMWTLPLTAWADNYVPSVEQKGAPNLVSFLSEDGDEYVAIIQDGENNVLSYVPRSGILITPYSKAGSAPEAIRIGLENAYSQIANAQNLAVLTAEIEQKLAGAEGELTADDLIVRDLFDISLSDEYLTVLENDPENKLVVCFSMGGDPRDVRMVLHNHADAQWDVLEEEQTVLNEDGSLTLTLESLSPFSFLVEKTKEEAAPFDVKKHLLIGLCILILAVGLVGWFFVLAARRKKQQSPVTTPIDMNSFVKKGAIGVFIGMTTVGASFVLHNLQKGSKTKKSNDRSRKS